jgi:hypothetical protein
MEALNYEKDRSLLLQNLEELRDDLKTVNIGSIAGFQKLKELLKDNDIKMEIEKPNSQIFNTITEVAKIINKRFENGINSNISIYTKAYKQFDYFITKYNLKPYLVNKTLITENKREIIIEKDLVKYKDYILNKKYYDYLKRK